MNPALACQALGVSRSGYHTHLRKPPRPRRHQDAQLAIEIRAAFTASRRILGWSTREDLATELPHAAWERAMQTRGSKQNGLLHHSDRGCQYTSTEFRQHLKLRGITASMSRTANCYEIATMESFCATLKVECFGTTIPLTQAHRHTPWFSTTSRPSTTPCASTEP